MMVNPKVDEFLKRSDELLETSKADIKQVRTALKTIHQEQPSLVDPEIFSTLNRIAENTQIAKDAKDMVHSLNVRIENLEKTVDSLTVKVNELRSTGELSLLNKKLGEKLLK